jgi:hypothetical protein
MMDERSKNMRDLLFALPTSTSKQEWRRSDMAPDRTDEKKPTVSNVAARRCLCCMGIGVNHDE